MAKYDVCCNVNTHILEVFIVVFLLGAAHALTNDFENDPKFLEGKEQYQITVIRSKEPRYGQCWKDALSVLETGCKQLTDDVQHRLALKFANCLFIKNGMADYPCEDAEAFSQCTSGMTSEAFMTYTQFFTHTQNMCFFLESQVWQEQTDMTINRLAETSSEVVQRIEDSSKLQSEVISKQNESLQNQKIFIERGAELKKLLEDSTVDVHKMLEEFKDTTSEQRDLIFEVFEKLTVLQSLVLGEFTGFYSLLFYTLSILICYMLTSTPRTSGSRFWLFVVMTCNVVSERLLTYLKATTVIDQDGNVIDENVVVYSRLWWCRKVYTSVAILIWTYFACTFRDLNKINNELLEQIKKQNSDLKRLLQGSEAKEVTSNGIRQSVGPIERTVPLMSHEREKASSILNISSTATSDRINSSTGYESDSDYTSDNESQASDKTFVYSGEPEHSDTESTCSFMTSSSFTSRMSRESTPSLLAELRDIRNATPLREMTPIPDVTSLDTSRDSSVSSVRRRGRPRGSGRRSTPVLSSERPVVTYNLRSRRGVTRQSENPVVHTESAEDFSKLVRHLSGVATRNTAKVNATVERHGGVKMFSSDED